MSAAPELVLSIEQFECGNIDPESFNHEAHVYVGWLYTHAYPLAEAVEKFDAALRRLVVKVGAEGKYHATLTWFFMLLIGERHQEGESWSEFCRSNADIFETKTLLARYYSEERLFSDVARQRFVLPDRIVG